MGLARKEVLKELFLSKKILNVRMAYAACEPSVPSPPANLWGGKRSGKGEGPLRFLPPGLPYFAMSALNKNSREAERYF